MKIGIWKHIIIGGILGLLATSGTTLVGAIIGLFVGMEDDTSTFEYKVGFVAGSAYWITFFVYMFYKGVFETKKEKNESNKGTN